MKKQLLRIHKFIALAAGALIVALCVSGALLVFRDTLAPVATPSLRVAASAEPVAFTRILATAQLQAASGETIEIRPHADPGRAALVALHGDAIRFMYVHPQTGASVVGATHNELLFETLFRFHRYFLVGDRGEYLVACLAGLLIVLAISGVVMWWPRKWHLAWRVRRDANRLAFNFDLHRAAGSLIAPFLLVNAITGLVLIFSNASTALVDRLFSAQAVAKPSSSPRTGPDNHPSLDNLVQSANAAFPSGVVTQVMVYGADRPIVVRKRTSAESNPLGGNRIYMDPRSGDVVAVVPRNQLTPGVRMYEWLYPLHTGILLGTPHRLLLVATGAGTLLMLVSGLLVWQARRRIRR